MARSRISTTVDSDLLEAARRLRATTDSQLIDEALTALVQAHRSGEIDAAYEASYRRQPLDGEDEWGDLASFRKGAGSS